jgi:hypothetical protein
VKIFGAKRDELQQQYPDARLSSQSTLLVHNSLETHKSPQVIRLISLPDVGSQLNNPNTEGEFHNCKNLRELINAIAYIQP